MAVTGRTSLAPAAVAKAEGNRARYEVQERLASGGMGVVYRVFDRVAGEVRAMKRIVAKPTAQNFLAGAFEREYHVLASLDHPRIIRVFDYGVDEQGPYYTMELLAGQDMRQSAPLNFKQACQYLRDVATSLSLLHSRRLIHRDLSPTNVRMTADGRCKLIDFGALADFGQSPVIVGTPPGIAPEALDGLPLDHRYDLFALGALAYWMLTGRHAFPVRRVSDLRRAWDHTPPAPSALIADIPKTLDALVLSLLNLDPLGRPSSAAEVAARLTVVAELEPDDVGEAEQLAQSFLSTPRFMGRRVELHALQALIDGATRGSGGALRIRAVPGMGRSRLLEEIGLRAQLAGALVVRVDAGAAQHLHGTSQTLAIRLLDIAPEIARDRIAIHRPALISLGSEVDHWLRARPSLAPPPGTDEILERHGEATQLIGNWFVEISRSKPLVIQVDNVEFADDASLGLLAALAQLATSNRMLVLVTERVTRDAKLSLARIALQTQSAALELGGLSPSELLELVRSLFGDAPNAVRFADWLHARTAGSPLHAVEICRQLLATRIIRFAGGIWTLPDDRPANEQRLELSAALSIRLANLSKPARTLAECLSMQRERPTLELCRHLVSSQDLGETLRLLDELARYDVVHVDNDSYRLSSTALRDVLLGELDELRLVATHKRIGETFVVLAGEDNPKLRVEAGWHLIRGGDELRGADLISSITSDGVTARTLIANLYRAGLPFETALLVYGKHRRPLHERLPLMAALANAGYYEDRTWGDRYGDQALDAVENVTGLATARKLRPFLGRWLSLILGLLSGWLRFQMIPRSERKYTFLHVMTHLFSIVTTLAGTAALSLDATRAASVAKTLEPFSVLPERLTPVGIYEFCTALVQITREHQTTAYATFERLIERFGNPRFYPTLPSDARRLYVAAAHFARAAFAIFRADGRGALESADALDAAGLKLYSMIASQLRFLYYVNRGELAKAAPHRQQVELHAAQVGSVWQVETWEAPALILVHTSLEDLVETTRVAHRIELLSRTLPSLRRYARLAHHAVAYASGDNSITRTLEEENINLEPRSFIGWAASLGFLARAYNYRGMHREAKGLAESILQHLTEADLDYTSLFLLPLLELAKADAALGDKDAALGRVDRLQERFKDCGSPLVVGSLHETRARICAILGDQAGFAQSLARMEQVWRATGTPVLIARCEQLARTFGQVTRGVAARLETGLNNGSSDAACDTVTQAILTSRTSPRIANDTSQNVTVVTEGTKSRPGS